MRSTISALAVIALAGCNGCNRTPEPTAESREQPAKATAPAARPSAAATPPSTAAITWKDPPGWKRETPSSPMRKATYRIPKAKGDSEDGELGVFQFGARGGGVEQNIERWVKQFEGVKPKDAKRSERTVDGMRVHLVEIPSGTYQSGMPGGPTTPKENFAMLGAIVEAPGGSWFFKLTGPKKTVGEARAAFDQLIDSAKKP